MILPQGSPSSKIMLIQEYPGEQEFLYAKPFMGRAGQELDRMLRDAGIDRSECFVTSLLRDRFDTTRILAHRAKDRLPIHEPLHDRFADPVLLAGYDLLLREIELVRPEVIVCFGNLPLFALSGKWGIKQWRGSTVPHVGQLSYSPAIIPVYSPAFILSVWKERPTTIQDLRRVKQDDNTGVTEWDFTLRPSAEAVISILDGLLDDAAERQITLACDIETRSGHMDCIGLAWSDTQALCIPLTYFDVRRPYWLEEEEVAIVFRLYQILTHPNVGVVGQNFIYDAQYIYRHWHFIPNFARDAMIAHHVMFNSMQKSLDFLSAMYCKQHVYWKKQTKLTEDDHWAYNAKDCCITYEVDRVEQEAIDKLTATTWPECRAVHDFQQSLFHPVLQSMNRGLRVDRESKSRLAAELFSAIQERENYILEVIGRPLNIKSHPQMTDFFYREINQKTIRSRPKKDGKGGGPTCNDAALETIGMREPLLLPLLRVISELRTLGVFLSTFVNAPLDVDLRMRCSFNVAGTSTYRFSSSQNAFDSGMNLQNIPKGDE